ncbi:hypothetical protein AAVH_00943 [Aphelenchoides avenae]|nr:hypothetical protein AAVH_00943 [Aphelenchus avenae]
MNRVENLQNHLNVCAEAREFVTITYNCVLLCAVFIVLCLLMHQSNKLTRLYHRVENLQNHLKDRESVEQPRTVKVPIEEKKPLTQNYTFHVGCPLSETRAKPTQPPPSPPVRHAYSPATNRRHLAISGPEITLMEHSLSSRLNSPGNMAPSDATHADTLPTPFRPSYQQPHSPRSPLADTGRRSFEDALKDSQNRNDAQTQHSEDANAMQTQESHSLHAQDMDASQTLEKVADGGELEMKPLSSASVTYTKMREIPPEVSPLPSRFPLAHSHRTLAVREDYENSTIH